MDAESTGKDSESCSNQESESRVRVLHMDGGGSRLVKAEIECRKGHKISVKTEGPGVEQMTKEKGTKPYGTRICMRTRG
jgi:hypothetical protein